jgi:SAM-dependent methyltransferase
MSAQPNDDSYMLGRTAAEERRLQRQAVLYGPGTRLLFDAAGISAGMKVLDLGSGAGDVAMLVAEMVGPSGTIVGVDQNPTVLETARRRVTAAGHTNITFVVGDLHEVSLDDDFDAVVGRAILMYLRDPAAVLRRMLRHLRAGGVAAFYEFDCTVPGIVYPPSAIGEQVYRWITQGVAYSGAECAMGMKLHQVFLDAGLEAPQMLVDALTGGSQPLVEEVTGYLADTVRSMLPLLLKSAIATEEEVGIETLAARFRDEVLQQGSVIRSYLFLSAWARKA